jgi:CRP-like cAMP-binding protein
MPIRSGLSLAIGSVPARPANIAVIDACRLFRTLDSKTKSWLAENSFMAYADTKEILWMAGAPAEFCSVVGTGLVKMSRHEPGGQEVTTERIEQGEAFGVIEAIEGRPFAQTVTALANTWYLKIPTRELLQLIRDGRVQVP